MVCAWTAIKGCLVQTHIQRFLQCAQERTLCRNSGADVLFANIDSCIMTTLSTKQSDFPPKLRMPCHATQADMSTSADHIQRVRTALPFEPLVAVSAESESWLCKQRRAEWVQYDSGAAAAVVVTPAIGSSGGGAESEGRSVLPPVGGLQRLQQIQKTVLDRWVDACACDPGHV